MITDGEDGVLVKPGDARDLSAAIGSLLADPAKRRRFGESGRRKVRNNYTWRHVIDRFERACLGCLKP